MRKKINKKDIPMMIYLAQKQGINVIRDGGSIYFINPEDWAFKKLNKERYKGKGRPRESDYDYTKNE